MGINHIQPNQDDADKDDNHFDFPSSILPPAAQPLQQNDIVMEGDSTSSTVSADPATALTAETDRPTQET